MNDLPRTAGPIFNQDSTEFFYTYSADEMSGETVDAYIDRLKKAGVATFVSCGNAQRANYASEVWESDWHGYDSEGPDDQPVLKHALKEQIKPFRRRLDSAKRLSEMGVDFHERALARCRHHGMGAWMTMRMNDVHGCMELDSPLLSTFYKEQRAAKQLRNTHRDTSWADRSLDWERPEVQEHYFKFVCEQLSRYDMDGLELDWMRFGYHFRPGRELAGGHVITAWMRRVKKECERAAERLGHPVKLGVRVPSRPETARMLGMDGVAWAKEGLVDVVAPSPFWATCEFDIPMQEWGRLLEGTSVELVGCLEIRYQPIPYGPATMMTPELAAGAALSVLHGGADQVYLFNYFPSMHGLTDNWGAETIDSIFHAMKDASALEKLSRRHAITYRDVRAPGEPLDNALPATDLQNDMPSPSGCALRINTGPKPVDRKVELLLEFDPERADPASSKVYVNSIECGLKGAVIDGVARYAVPCDQLENESQVIDIIGGEAKAFTIVRAEISIAPTD